MHTNCSPPHNFTCELSVCHMMLSLKHQVNSCQHSLESSSESSWVRSTEQINIITSAEATTYPCYL